MVMINNKHVLQALAFAISKIEKKPFEDFERIRASHYHEGCWKFHFVLSHNNFHPYRVCSDSLVNNLNPDLQHDDIPFEGIDEALALAGFVISNRPDILTAHLFSLGQGNNLWRVRYKCETRDGQWILIKIVIDTHSFMIIDIDSTLLNTQKDTH